MPSAAGFLFAPPCSRQSLHSTVSDAKSDASCIVE